MGTSSNITLASSHKFKREVRFPAGQGWDVRQPSLGGGQHNEIARERYSQAPSSGWPWPQTHPSTLLQSSTHYTGGPHDCPESGIDRLSELATQPTVSHNQRAESPALARALKPAQLPNMDGKSLSAEALAGQAQDESSSGHAQ